LGAAAFVLPGDAVKPMGENAVAPLDAKTPG
jgi:hypothetical protein